jgi:hypothetical protein
MSVKACWQPFTEAWQASAPLIIPIEHLMQCGRSTNIGMRAKPKMTTNAPACITSPTFLGHCHSSTLVPLTHGVIHLPHGCRFVHVQNCSCAVQVFGGEFDRHGLGASHGCHLQKGPSIPCCCCAALCMMQQLDVHVCHVFRRGPLLVDTAIARQIEPAT